MGLIKCLLIEDDDQFVMYIKNLYKECEDTVKVDWNCVSSCSQAQERLQTPGIDVVLLDLNLPNGRGLGTLARVITSSPETPVVVMTGDNSSNIEEDVIKHGAQDYIRKTDLNKSSFPILLRMLRHSIIRHRERMQTSARWQGLANKLQELRRLKQSSDRLIDTVLMTGAASPTLLEDINPSPPSTLQRPATQSTATQHPGMTTTTTTTTVTTEEPTKPEDKNS